MPSYLEAVKARLEQIKQQNSKSDKKDDKAKVNFFKPEVGKEYEVRFLPYLDKNNQPFEAVSYYNNMHETMVDGKMKTQRVIAPFQYGLPDPIADFLAEMQKETKGRTEEAKAAWKEWNKQRAKERFYALLIDRADEAKGPQIMELSNDECVAAYTTFAHKDLAEEDVFDPNSGYDFTLACAPDPTGKTFNGKPVRKLSFTARRKPSKLGDKKQMEAWLAMLPDLNLHEYFKKFSPNEEKCRNIVDNYTAKKSGEVVSQEQSDTGKNHGVEPSTKSASETDIDNSLNELFSEV